MRFKNMNILKNHRILEKYTMYPVTLGNCSSVTAPALPYYCTSCTYALPCYLPWMAVYAVFGEISGLMMFFEVEQKNMKLVVSSITMKYSD